MRSSVFEQRRPRLHKKSDINWISLEFVPFFTGMDSLRSSLTGSPSTMTAAKPCLNLNTARGVSSSSQFRHCRGPNEHNDSGFE